MQGHEPRHSSPSAAELPLQSERIYCIFSNHILLQIFLFGLDRPQTQHLFHLFAYLFPGFLNRALAMASEREGRFEQVELHKELGK